MLFHVLTVVAFLAAGVHAHFRLLFPEPRGVYVSSQEPSFCGGYNNAVNNRSTFPLSGGFFQIRQGGHPDWVGGVLISTVQNPNSFDNFTIGGQQQYLRPLAKEHRIGNFCIPLDIASANIPGAVDGANVTIQVVLAGGDGNLYQCADLTLSSTYKTPSDITCVNSSVEATVTHSASSTSPSSSQTTASDSIGRAQYMSGFAALTLSLLGMALAML